ncbi:unnamed protein product [Merluccius merluccius]
MDKKSTPVAVEKYRAIKDGRVAVSPEAVLQSFSYSLTEGPSSAISAIASCISFLVPVSWTFFSVMAAQLPCRR